MTMVRTFMKIGLTSQNMRLKNKLYKREGVATAERSRIYFLLIKYSCIALAAFLPMPIALITVAAPVATSPPA